MKNFIVVLICSIIFFSCDQKISHVLNPPDSYEIKCGGEEISSHDKNLLVSSNSNFYVKGGNAQTKDKVRSGNFSLQCNPSYKYIMGVTLKNVKPDDHFIASIWRYGGNQQGILAVGGIDHMYTSKSIDKDENGWELLRVEFYVPPNFSKDEIKVFFWNAGEETIYVDDFKLTKVSRNFPIYSEEALRIYISDKGLEELNQRRVRAFEEGMLIKDDESFVKGIMFFGGEQFKAKLRLKGDWLDHIQGEKWSFRVALKKGAAWRGMKTFNIQTPNARSFIDEWVAHKIAEREDILTTRYEFVPVYLNSKSLGCYVYEEHFEKQLIENKNRKEGPILKFNEEHIWLSRKLGADAGFSGYEAAHIVPFKESKILKSPTLSEMFVRGREKLHDFRSGGADVNQIFDVDKMAKYVAFIDFVRGHHNIIWHNLRFYYNPAIDRLEPIAYDIYSDSGPFANFGRTLTGNFDINKAKPYYDIQYSLTSLFSDSLFAEKYMEHIRRFKSPEYLNEFYREFDPEIKELEKMIIAEFQDYTYNDDLLRTNQVEMEKEFDNLSNSVNSNFASTLLGKKSKANSKKDSVMTTEMLKHFLHIYNVDSGYVFKNYFSKRINLVAYVKNGVNNEFKDSRKMEGYSDEPQIIFLKNDDAQITHFIAQMDGSEDQCFVPVSNWPYIDGREDTGLEKWPEWMVIENEMINIEKGYYTLTEGVVIPSNITLNIDPGVNLDLVNGAYVLSYGNMHLNGSPEEPVIIHTSDNSSRGITVLQAEKKSIIRNAQLEGLGNLKINTWELPGAINFYESEVEILGSTIKNNRCEDALNIVRSNFLVHSCSFDNIFADAFDSDFSKGLVSNSTFRNIGNDAIDFSGSIVTIDKCDITEVKDKGISGGEASTLEISDNKIRDCNIAIAAKDKSILTVNNNLLNNCSFGFVCYVKKSEYGPSGIISRSTEVKDIHTVHLIEEGSYFIIDQDSIIGQEKNLVDLFY